MKKKSEKKRNGDNECSGLEKIGIGNGSRRRKMRTKNSKRKENEKKETLPCNAIAMAIFASVTVSMHDETRGT